jgi:hypothetical protein
MMAGQPAVDLGLLLFMTLDAKSHLKIHRAETIHGFHVSVTLDTVDFSENDVRLMPEFYVIGHKIDLDPRNGGLAFVMFSFLHDLRVHGDHVLVTEETFFQRRDPGVIGPVHERMAESAVDLFDARMDPVAEIDGLLRADAPIRKPVKQVQHRHCEESQDSQPYLPAYGAISSFLVFSHFALQP